MFQYVCWGSRSGVAHSYSSGYSLIITLEDSFFQCFSMTGSETMHISVVSLAGQATYKTSASVQRKKKKKGFLTWKYCTHQKLTLFYISNINKHILILCQKVHYCLKNLKTHIMPLYSGQREQDPASNMYIWWLTHPSGWKQWFHLSGWGWRELLSRKLETVIGHS